MDAVTNGRLVDGDHVVSFYDGAERLTEFVVHYLATAVRNNETVIVIATPEHRASFAAALGANGIDIHDALCTMRVRLYDAAEMLTRFMRDGKVDHHLFADSVGLSVREALTEGRPVRAFGEMVALLWAAGNRSGAIELEHAWNRLGAHIPFSLLCAYPQSVADDAAAADDLLAVCDSHSHVIQGAAAS